MNRMCDNGVKCIIEKLDYENEVGFNGYEMDQNKSGFSKWIYGLNDYWI